MYVALTVRLEAHETVSAIKAVQLAAEAKSRIRTASCCGTGSSPRRRPYHCMSKSNALLSLDSDLWYAYTRVTCSCPVEIKMIVTAGAPPQTSRCQSVRAPKKLWRTYERCDDDTSQETTTGNDGRNGAQLGQPRPETRCRGGDDSSSAQAREKL